MSTHTNTNPNTTNTQTTTTQTTARPAPHVSLFHRTVARGTVRGALSLSAVLGLTLGITTVPTPANARAVTPATAPAPAEPAPKPPPPEKQSDFDHDALSVSTTTDTLPEDHAEHYQAIAGDPVRRVYYLQNRGLLPLTNVTVFDPGNNGAAIHCDPTGTATIPTLLPLGWITCEATFTAAPGEHHTTVSASGTVFLFDATVTDEDETGYTAVIPGLSASLSLNGGQPTVNLPAGNPVSADVTVVNSGSVALEQVTPITPQPPLSITTCGHDGPEVDKLNAGESVLCTGTLIPDPGTHVSSVTITGIWRWDHPITEQGPQHPQELRVQTTAEAPYTGVLISSPPPPSPPATPPPSAPAPPPPTPAPPQPSPGVVVPPQFSPPPPSPSPNPSHRPTPGPTPTQPAAMLQQAVSQFQSSRGLSLPLKVLVIIIIPAGAAAAGARRIASHR